MRHLVMFLVWNLPLVLTYYLVSRFTDYNMWVIMGVMIVCNFLGIREGTYKEARKHEPSSRLGPLGLRRPLGRIR